MIICEDVLRQATHPDGKRHVVASLISSERPAEFPKDGAGIGGLTGNDILEMGSTVYVIHGAELYIMDESHDFIRQ